MLKTDAFQDLSSFGTDPFALFEEWHRKAVDERLPEPDAMTLATLGLDGRPSARIVLYKGHETGTIHFYTNYESRKGRELERTPYATLVFHWNALARQVRIEGKAEKLSREQSALYFHSRARDSQIGAWASQQSRPLDARETLIERQARFTEQFEGKEVPLPPHWGGYGLTPDRFEFWVGQPNRLHDRCIFRRDGQGWKKERLFP